MWKSCLQSDTKSRHGACPQAPLAPALHLAADAEPLPGNSAAHFNCHHPPVKRVIMYCHKFLLTSRNFFIQNVLLRRQDIQMFNIIKINQSRLYPLPGFGINLIGFFCSQPNQEPIMYFHGHENSSSLVIVVDYRLQSDITQLCSKLSENENSYQNTYKSLFQNDYLATITASLQKCHYPRYICTFRSFLSPFPIFSQHLAACLLFGCIIRNPLLCFMEM